MKAMLAWSSCMPWSPYHSPPLYKQSMLIAVLNIVLRDAWCKSLLLLILLEQLPHFILQPGHPLLLGPDILLSSNSLQNFAPSAQRVRPAFWHPGSIVTMTVLSAMSTSYYTSKTFSLASNLSSTLLLHSTSTWIIFILNNRKYYKT